MSADQLTSAQLRADNAEAIRLGSTFNPRGVSYEQALDFLDTAVGEKYLAQLEAADPNISEKDLFDRALQQIQSGRTLPTLRTIDEPLVKVIPHGTSVSPYSPFFTTESEIGRALNAGQSLADRFGLPIASEAQRYDLYAIRPKGSVEVFVSEVAPTVELDGQVRRSGGALQYLVPNRGLYSQAELVHSVDNTLSAGTTYRSGLSSALGVIDGGTDAVRLGQTRLRAGAALGVAGLALDAYDAADSMRTASRLRSEGNATAAQSELIHFGGRTVGGLAGAGLGFGLGAVAGVETGPGLLVTGAVGGVVGAVAGDKLAAWTDNRAIYNQLDRQGNEWSFDPDKQDLGWRRKAPIDGTDDAIDNARRAALRASPALENELNFQATAKSVELVLGSPPVPRDPFEQSARPGDPGSPSNTPWRRDADSGAWQRTITLLPDGRPTHYTVPASAERAAELDNAAAQTVLANSANAAPAIAARFEDAYARNGWAAYGAMPEAVRNARTNADALVASDGDRYERQPDGAWLSKGVLYDSSANANVREELDATRTLLRERLPPPQAITAPPPMTEQQRLRDTIVGAYRNAGVALDAQQLDARVQAVGRTWAEHGLDPTRTALQVQPVASGNGLDSPITSLRLEQDGKTYRIAATTTADDIERAKNAASTGAHAIDPLTPSQIDTRREVIEGANRQGLSRDEAQQVGRQASIAPGASTFAPLRAMATDLSEPSHPGHASYTRALDDVRRMEVREGIPHGDHSKRLAATVAIAVEREKLDVQRLDMGQDGQVIAVERGPYPNFDERRVPIDTRQALSQGMDASSAQWLAARSPHYAGDRVALERTDDQSRALAQLSPADRGMFDRIRQSAPPHVSDDVVAHTMLMAKGAGIGDASRIDQTVFAGDRLFVSGTTPGQRAMADVTAPTPALNESVRQAQQLDQQRETRTADIQRTQEPAGRSVAIG